MAIFFSLKPIGIQNQVFTDTLGGRQRGKELCMYPDIFFFFVGNCTECSCIV